jgi:hypothetical protein
MMVWHMLSLLVLLLLPGSWLGMALSLPDLSFSARLALSGVLSPLVAAVQLLLLRTFGVSFAHTVWLLIAINAPAAWLLIARWPRQIQWKPALSVAAVYVLLAVYVILPSLLIASHRIFESHSWMHAAIVVQFPEGGIAPEEPELAGVRLAYPWLDEAYLSTIGWAADWGPTRVYILTNAVNLLWVCLLFREICVGLGATESASSVGLVWLALGTNVLGFLYWYFVMHHAGWMPGDIRNTPWLGKFATFDAAIVAIPAFAGMMLLAVNLLRKVAYSYIALIALLVSCIGLIYPQLFPAAAAFAFLLFLYLLWPSQEQSVYRRSAMWLGVAVCLACIPVLVYARTMSVARVEPLVYFSRPSAAIAKLATAGLSLAILLVPVAFLPRSWLWRKPIMLLLVGAALPSILLRSLLQVSAGANEYKFMSTAALGLAPVTALALHRWLLRGGRKIVLVAISVIFALLAPLELMQGKLGIPRVTNVPEVSDSHFYLQLAPDNPQAAWIEAIRAKSPANAIVVIEKSRLFLPALVARSEWAPPQHSEPLPGYRLDTRWNLVLERGYPAALFDGRERVLDCIFHCDDAKDLNSAEAALLSLMRPVVVVFLPDSGSSFEQLIRSEGNTSLLYRDAQGTSVWVLEPSNLQATKRP